ncbi:hypothetical protein [Dactylosporangium sp. NPDC048998]|uniref:hypothetical protein n=1 Tax=Dactylosporangium sp. NPDC048998 TaxID=3363976 RepID=UPI003714AEB0
MHAAKLLMFGGTIIINALVLLAPPVLLVRGVIGTVRRVAARSARPVHLPPPRPHPAARQFGGPESYQPHPPAAYQPSEHVPRRAAPAPRMDVAPIAPAPRRAGAGPGLLDGYRDHF